MTKLTARQAEIFNFIKGYIKSYQMSPTSKEIADHFEIYPNGAAQHVKALLKKGALENRPGKIRSIRPVKGYRVSIKR